MTPDIRRIVLEPYWHPEPLRWRTGAGQGIAFFALEGRAGMFNLAWLTSQSPKPEGMVVDHQALRWIITNSSMRIGPCTLEQHASFLTLEAFWYEMRDYPSLKRVSFLSSLLEVAYLRLSNGSVA